MVVLLKLSEGAVAGVEVLGSMIGTSALGSTSVTTQILAVWSAEQVASFLTSGESRIRVMASLWAEKWVMGTRSVFSMF